MNNIMKYVFYVMLLTAAYITRTSDNDSQPASDNSYIFMNKPITIQPSCIALPTGYTFSWYDETNIEYVADQIAPLWNDPEVTHNCGPFNPSIAGFHLVFRDNNNNNQVCAYAKFAACPDWGAQIRQLAVHEDYRRRGLATTFIRFIESYGATVGCQEMSLMVRQNNTPAVAAYQRQGFASTYE